MNSTFFEDLCTFKNAFTFKVDTQNEGDNYEAECKKEN